MTAGERARVLVVDDDPAMRRSVERVLSPLYEVGLASSASEALALIRSATAPFDVAVVDIQLGSDGDGYSLCQRARELSPDTEVILITGSVSQSDEKLFRSLEEGAFYFLFKPFERRVLRALLERCVRLKRERSAKELYANELREDLERARLFQQSLLPRAPLEAAGWHAEGRFAPCDLLGGDFYFTIAERGGGVSFGVCDIVGHGVSAAMYAGMLRSSLDAARRQDAEPAGLLRALYAGIDFLEAPRAASLVYGLLSPDGALRYVSAGHPPLLLQRRGGDAQWLGATGMLLTCSLPPRVHEPRESRLEPGDRILACTDGIFEARSPDEREWGLDALAAAFHDCRGLPADQTLDRILRSVREHCAGRPLADDATLLLVDRR